MAGTYIVHVDLERLRLHRSGLERRPLSKADIHLWLVNYGFYPRIDGLYVAEAALLHLLDPDSIREVRPVVDMPQ